MKTKLINIMNSLLILSSTLNFTPGQAQEVPGVSILPTQTQVYVVEPTLASQEHKVELPEPDFPEMIPERYGMEEEYPEREYIPPSPEDRAETSRMVQSFNCADVTDVPQIECEALVALYNSTNGEGWTYKLNWLETTTVGEWYGLYATSGHVTHIDLISNNLTGDLTSALGSLTYLIYLGLNYNQITGTIPSSLGNLTNLRNLNLSDNFLDGPIPSELGGMTNLEQLNLFRNQLSGSIPTSLGNLSSLRYLELWNNNLTGNIPSSLGSIMSLRRINLANNELSGSIPPEIGNPPLEILVLANNQLTGSLPSELGDLIYLNQFLIQGNPLFGSIPLTYTNLASLGNFYFYDTSICEPDTPEFLDWKATVSDWQGSGLICDPNEVDIYFRPAPDGYGFENWPSINPFDFTGLDLARMFGADAVCWKVIDSVCILKPKAELFMYKETLPTWGHCLGMSVTSLRFFNHLDLPLSLDELYFLQKDSPVLPTWQGETYSTTARRNISFFHFMQVADPFATYADEIMQNPPSIILTQAFSLMSGGNENYPIIFFYNMDKKQGHAVTPYAIDDQGDGIYRIRIYDNNYPGYLDKEIIINTNIETWFYTDKYNGNAGTHNLGVAPISIFAQRPFCPWCESVLQQNQMMQITIEGTGELLIQDSLSRRLGYQDGIIYEEIPGAYANPRLTGLDIETQPIFYLPLIDDYEMTLSGDPSKAADEASVVVFGPDYGVEITGIAVDSTTSDVFSISNDGRNLAYRPNQNQEITFGLYLDSEDASWQLETSQIDIQANNAIQLTFDPTQKILDLDNALNGSSVYNLYFKRVSDLGSHFFLSNEINLSIASSHYIHIDGWQDTGFVELDVDQDGDGFPENTIYLPNQIKNQYLPLISN